MTTIKEVAKMAGVSVATVSRVINDNGYVKESTKKHIEEVIKQLNYMPNEAARTLFKKKSKIIGLLLPDISNPFFMLIARGVEDIALKHGYQVLIGNSDNTLDKAKDYISIFNSHNCIGVISTAFDHHTITELIAYQHIPFVYVDRLSEKQHGVSTNHYQGGQLQANIVIKGNAKHVLIIHEDLSIEAFKLRYEGTKNMLTQEHISFHSCLATQIEDETQFERMISGSSIDTIICSNDVLAIKVLGMVQQLNYNVPNDIQIVGYDNIPFSEMTFPQITTIDQSAYHLGTKAVSKLLNIDDKPFEEIELIIKKRQSTRN
ncbi:LacI family transcriptional regulator [Staphylococcus sp. ACRSN]|uniref:LacI family DNA-binding transcriptional regulator n=1 Tax=Staphylococcus sp. ACRSN TaxID=2918214 RepID=UPI001EF2B3B7|nr:LacI family DNA-binding transcriptional regulator [Staphylococcus sp. ACRSN]MCG7339527.1 LacI family transcriptional regulator [Staphylococcus sp. ACRSN]